MGWLFRKSVKVAPGVRANVSKSGVSVSVGVRGAHVTRGKNGVTTSVGVPGTGLYHRSYSSYSKLEAEKERKADAARVASVQQKEALKRHPFLMVLSAICCAMVPLSIIIPPIPWWVMFPSGIVGIGLYCKAHD